MAFESERCKWIFLKVERDALRLSSEPDAATVHSFRTTCRRLETLLQRLIPVCDGNQKKLLKLLARIRRRAGRIRDIDVQLAALRSFRVPQEPRRKRQLVEQLIEVREEQEQRLAKLLKRRYILEIHKRARRALQTLKISSLADPLAVAKEILSSVSLAGPVTDEVLHRYRIAVKRARYAAEFARRSSEATQFIARLKQVQDALGNWHDWMTLTQTAKKQLGEVSQSPLVAVLHNETRVKFRYAVAALSRNDADDKPGVSRKLGLNVQRHLAPTQAA